MGSEGNPRREPKNGGNNFNGENNNWNGDYRHEERGDYHVGEDKKSPNGAEYGKVVDSSASGVEPIVTRNSAFDMYGVGGESKDNDGKAGLDDTKYDESRCL